jgi:hypothetical protein
VGRKAHGGPRQLNLQHLRHLRVLLNRRMPQTLPKALTAQTGLKVPTASGVRKGLGNPQKKLSRVMQEQGTACCEE